MMSDVNAFVDVVRRPTARRMRLSVDRRTGRVILVLPERAALGPALKWAKQHQGWIAAQSAKIPEPWPIEPGMIVPFAGRDLTLDWAPGKPRNPVISDDCIRVGGPAELLPARLIRWLRREALRILRAETFDIAAVGGLSVSGVGVGDPRSRWGSCAADGTIRYSWRLLLAPDYVRRATVAHEVAHRRHMDHSPAFHREVERLLGEDPRAARTWLRRHGARLHWFGISSRDVVPDASSMNF
jgi:predicted metal-dependent hydrolase